MLRETEAFLRWLIEAKQVAAHGFANAVTTSRMLGDILATIVEAQFALKRRMCPAALAAESTSAAKASEAGQSRQPQQDARVARVSPLVGSAARADRRLEATVVIDASDSDPEPDDESLDTGP